MELVYEAGSNYVVDLVASAQSAEAIELAFVWTRGRRATIT